MAAMLFAMVVPIPARVPCPRAPGRFGRSGIPIRRIGQIEDGLALARKLAHPFSEVWALTSMAAVHQLRGEPEATLEHAEAASAIAEEKGFALYVGWTGAMRGWALGEQEPSAEAIAEIRQGLDASRATGADL